MIRNGSENGKRRLMWKQLPKNSLPNTNVSLTQVETAVEGIPESENAQRQLYTQRLFNRLMFLRFIEKKRWLTYNGEL